MNLCFFSQSKLPNSDYYVITSMRMVIFLKTETKVEILRYILLQQSRLYDNVLFTLLSTRSLMNEIERIDERTFSFDIDPTEGMISASQFISNMNKFLKCMKTNFFNVLPFQMCVIEIIRNNEQELKELLSYTPTDSSDEKLEELVYKLIISSFIRNAKYVPSIQEELTTLDIRVKIVREYNLDESHKILQFISNIAFCQRGRGNVLELFDDIDARLDYFTKADNPIRNRKKNIEEYKTKYVESRIADYNKMFKTYNSKKKYLRYFV